MIPTVYFSLAITWQFYFRQSQKSCTSVVLVPFPWRSHHRNIGCDTLEYSPLSFREKRSVDPEWHLLKLLYSIWSGIWIPDQVRDDKWNTFQQSQNYSDLQLKILLKIIDWNVNQKNTDNICIILIWWLPKCSMIIYPVLNFVLPLMLSSFILVDKPSRCSDCQIKTELKVTENVKIERSQEIDAEVSSLESSAVTDGEHSESRKHKDTDWKLSVPPR